MSDLHKIVRYQFIWFILASAFNGLSYIWIKNGNLGWAGSGPERAQVIVILMGGVIALGYFNKIKLYRISLPFITFILLFGGVIRHILADHTTYFNLQTLLGAILINVFGVWAFALGTKITLPKGDFYKG